MVKPLDLDLDLTEPNMMNRAGSKLKSIMGKAANLTMPAAGTASGFAAEVAPAMNSVKNAAVGVKNLGLNLGEMAVNSPMLGKAVAKGGGYLLAADAGAGLANTLGGLDNEAVEGMQDKMNEGTWRRFVPNAVDQALRGTSALTGYGGTEAENLKKLGLDDASMEANGKLDPATMAILNARKAKAVPGLPTMEDLTPARVNTEQGNQTGRMQAYSNVMLQDALASKANIDDRVNIEGAGDLASAGNFHMARKLFQQTGAQAVAQQNADTNMNQLDVTQRGQDMTLMPRMGEVQRDKLINTAIARGDLEGAHRLAALGKPAKQDQIDVVPGDLGADVAPGVLKNGVYSPFPSRKELAAKRERDKNIQRFSTTTGGVRG